MLFQCIFSWYCHNQWICTKISFLPVSHLGWMLYLFVLAWRYIISVIRYHCSYPEQDLQRTALTTDTFGFPSFTFLK